MNEQTEKCSCPETCTCGCKNGGECKCGCGTKCNCWKKWTEPKFIFIVLSIIAVTSIVIISILRDRIVNQQQNQVSIVGQGRVSYQPDIANITLGMQVDKAPAADAALGQLNDNMNKILLAVEALGIKKENVKTEAYSVSPQYDYKNGISAVSGYGANQKIEIKIENIQENPELVNKVISVAGASGTNQIQGIDFAVSNMNDLKQRARILAIQDAKSKSAGLAEASGVKLGKIEGWYENLIQPVEGQPQGGYGGSETALSAKTIPSPQIPSGMQEIIIEISLNYEVK